MISILPGAKLWALRSAAYDERLRQAARRMPGIRFNFDKRQWEGTIDAIEACARSLGLKDQTKPVGIFRDLGGYSGLREYQKEGVRWLCEHAEEGALLADDLGLGKSCQALRAAKALKQRALVVCPAFVKGVWQAEAGKWWGEALFVTLSGTKPAPIHLEPTIAIINYDVLHAWIDPLSAWLGLSGTVIYDEIHVVKGLAARRTKACQEIAMQARYRIGLTGTPLDNGDPLNLYSIESILSPGRFGDKPFLFRLRYCGAEKKRVAPQRVVWENGEPTHIEELAGRVRHFALRRTKSQVMADLPARTRQIIPIKIAKKFQAPIGGALRDDAALRSALDLSADGKIPDAVALAHSHIYGGKSVIVFTHRRIVAEQICEALQELELNARYVHGGLTVEKRNAIVEQCRRDAARETRSPILAHAPILCCTLDSTGVGISLTFASVQIFAELDWVPAKLVQGEGRSHRHGQTEPTLHQYLIGEGTADELIMRAVIDKLDTFEQTFGKTDDALKSDLETSRKSGADALREFWQSMQEGG